MENQRKTPGGGNREGGHKCDISKDKYAGYSAKKQGSSFAEINLAALAVLPALLIRWLPDGVLRGREYTARNPRRADHHAGSFRINVCSGRWADFATGDAGGDVISLAAYLSGCKQGEAALELARMLGVTHG